MIIVLWWWTFKYGERHNNIDTSISIGGFKTDRGEGKKAVIPGTFT